MGKKHHIPRLAEKLVKYADSRALDFNHYSPYHMRISDGGYTVMDIWTTGRYYIMTTDYIEMLDKPQIERGGEKGFIPVRALDKFLDKVFYGEQ